MHAHTHYANQNKRIIGNMALRVLLSWQNLKSSKQIYSVLILIFMLCLYTMIYRVNQLTRMVCHYQPGTVTGPGVGIRIAWRHQNTICHCIQHTSTTCHREPQSYVLLLPIPNFHYTEHVALILSWNDIVQYQIPDLVHTLKHISITYKYTFSFIHSNKSKVLRVRLN